MGAYNCLKRRATRKAVLERLLRASFEVLMPPYRYLETRGTYNPNYNRTSEPSKPPEVP